MYSAQSQEARPRVLLELLSGLHATRRHLLGHNTVIRVGASSSVEIQVIGDDQLAEEHFTLEPHRATCWLRVLPGASPVQMEGRPLTEVELADRSSWRAGQTWFALHLRPATPPWDEALGGPFGVLREEMKETPLYALLDSARDERVISLLQLADEESQSLYEGTQGQMMVRQAPYLVRLTDSSHFLGMVLQEGWGKSWGIFLSSSLSFVECRRQLRRYLLVQDDTGRELYFRFYDPRVLRRFLPVCTPEQLVAFFEGIKSFFTETEWPSEILRWTWSRERLLLEKKLVR